MSKKLVVYYSWTNGNTKRIAERIAEVCDADIARIETAQPYEGTYEEIVEQGKREVEGYVTPAIKDLGVDVSDYDVIVIGTPTWWYTMAPAVLTFFKENSLAGKTVVLFMTNAGWPGTVIKDMTLESDGANVVFAKEIKFDQGGGATLETSEAEIENWIESIKNL